MKKRILVMLLMSIVVLISICGCEEKEENEFNINIQTDYGKSQELEKQNKEVEGTLTKALLTDVLAKNKVYIKYKTQMDFGMGEEEATVSYAINENRLYVDTSSSVSHIGMLSTEQETYSIMHDQKVYMKAEAQTIELGIVGEKVVNEKLQTAKFTEGKEAIEGKEYLYEEMFQGGEYNRFYFDPSTKLWEYWKLGDNQLLKIEEYRNTIEEEWFEVPEGYKYVEMP